jgi:transcriptional regulator with XRE-family HTH domain
MKNMYEYVNYIEVDKTVEELEEEFLEDFISFRKENNLTQELLAMYSKVNRVKISRIESKMHSPTVKNLLQILGPLGYTIKIEKIKRDKNKTTEY